MQKTKPYQPNDDYTGKFLSAMREKGYEPESIIDDVNIRRFSHQDKNGSQTGWFILFGGSSPGGAFGDWRSGNKFTWSAKNKDSLSKAELKEFQRQADLVNKRLEKERQERADAARRKALERWNEATPADEHPYLKRKQINAHGTKVAENGMLLVSMHRFNDSGEIEIKGIQEIMPRVKFKHSGSDKNFPAGTTKKGCFYQIGDAVNTDGPVYFCEGFATGASIHEAMDAPVECAFDAGNLDPVIETWRARYPDREFVICGDNDAHTGDNPGRTKAEAAGKKHSARVVLPVFKDGSKGTDFNDMAVAEDKKAVKKHIEADIKKQQDEANKKQATIKKAASQILEQGDPCGEFNIDFLPAVLGGYVSEICRNTHANPVMVLQSVLCTISALVGKKFYIGADQFFQKLYCNIWCCSISKSGTFKTTALNKGAALAFAKKEEVMHNIEYINSVHYDAKDEKKREERIMQLRRDDKILLSRSTAEGLMELLAAGCGGMILCSELGGWLENMNKGFTGSLKSTLTEFYDVNLFYEYVTRTKKPLLIEEPYISINGVSTLEWIQKNMEGDDVSSGFFPRFLFFYPPQEPQIPPALPIKISPSDHLAGDEMARILDILAKIPDNIPDNREFTLSPEAKKLFGSIHTRMYKSLYAQSEMTQTIIEPFVKRWSPYILKLAMMMEFLIDQESEVISHYAITFAGAVVEYAMKSTIYLFQNELGETAQQRKCRRILEYVAKKGGQVLWGALLQSKVLDGGSADYEYTCKTLQDAGSLILHEKPIKKDWLIQLCGD